MSRFAYIALRASGDRVTGSLRCGSTREAARKLLQLGYHPVSLQRQGSVGNFSQRISLTALKRIRVTELAVFTRQMASLLKAGMPVIQTLTTLRRQSSNARLAKTVEEVEETLSHDAGTLSDALEDYPKVFDPVYCGLVRSGEESGRLPEILNNLAKHLNQSAKLRGQIIGAFIYPIFLLILGVAAVFILMTLVVPKFQELFSSFGKQLPWPTQILIIVSDFTTKWWWAILAVMLISIVITITSLRKPVIRKAVDRRLLRLPVLGQMILKIEMARIAYTLSVLLCSGIRILEALRITADAVRNLTLRSSFDVLIKGVSAGEPLSTVAQRTGLYPPLMLNLIRTGEETGELPEMLTELSAIYEEEAERAITNTMRLLEPILIVMMGGIIAGIVAAVILPIFRANALATQ